MASAPQQTNLPLFYKKLVPVTSGTHGTWSARQTDKATWLVYQHAIPLTVEEFPMASRHFPIVFSAGEGANSVPLALMGMNEGVNVFVADDGSISEEIYMPGYARRYPFILARLNPDSEELSLCFDEGTTLVGEFEDGKRLFENGEPTEACMETLRFCENFEIAGNKTAQFIQELVKHDLLINGELSVQPEGTGDPIIYRGFRMVSEEKLKQLRGDVLRGWAQNGILPLIYAHLMSMQLVRDIFGRQVRQGKAPKPKNGAG